MTFDSESVTTDEATLRVYHFNLDVFGPYSEASDFLSTNTLPSNTPGLCFPGFFHSEPSSRLLALEVRMSDRYFGIRERDEVPLYVLYVPHDVLLGYIRSHPSNSHTVVVPWKAWGSGNAHILALPDPDPNRIDFIGRMIVCGMHAITQPPTIIVQGDQRMLRISDYHPRRIFRNSATGTCTQDTNRRGVADSHEGLTPPARQKAPDETIPHVFKDIPLPSGLRLENIKCALGEDVVAVFEVGIPTRSVVRYQGPHSVQDFSFLPQSTEVEEARECILSPHLVMPCISIIFPAIYAS